MTGRAVFLDRDGTVCRDPGRSRPAALELLPGVPAALAGLQQAGFRLIIVTNQAAVARGLLTERELAGEHAGLAARLRDLGVTLEAVHYCPHHPAAALARYRLACPCRKPEPGLLQTAARVHDIDLARSYMVGDKASDVAAGRRAGCRAVLVLSGETRAGPAVGGGAVAADLAAAARLIIGRRGARG